MSAPVVVVVDPKTSGNVGTIARAMKNFGFSELKVVDPPDLGRESEAYGFAGQAREDVLAERETVTFDEVVSRYHTVGFTAITNENAASHVRYPFTTPRELAERLDGVEAKTALVFGRERIGLTNEELERLDEICSIPATAEYPVLNLGQAATVALYELRDLTVDEPQHPEVRHERADEQLLEQFYDRFAEFLDTIDYPEQKRAKTGRMMRRLLGRAHPTGREVNTLFGLLQRAAWHVDAEDETEEVN